jgi:hypothetical protein
MGGSYLLLSTLNRSSAAMAAERDQKTQQALRAAKAAVLGWAVEDAQTSSMPGRMPCPEDTLKIGLTTEGDMQSSCTSATDARIGRLAWRTLRLGDLRDGWGERLWYVLSPGFRASPINGTTPGQLLLDGQAVVALIIAPGPAIGGQARGVPTSGSPPAYASYFESTNASSPVDLSFTSTGSSDSFNDRVIAITARELFDLVEPIAAKRISTDGDFSAYASQWGSYPFAAAFANPSTGYTQFRGTNAATQGLVPSTSESNDPSFVTWSTAITVTELTGSLGSLVGSPSCTTSGSPTSLTCTIGYRCTGGIGTPNTPLVSIALTANNAGMAFKSKIDTTDEIDYAWQSSSGGSATFSPASPADPSAPTQTMNTDGSVTVTWASVRMASYSTGVFTCSISSRRLRIVMSPLSDHSVLSSWFFTNEWYRRAYYAVAPRYTPGSSAGNCVSANSQNARTAIILSGPALSGQTQPNATVSHYLEGTNLNSANSSLLTFSGTGRTSAANDLATSVGSCP